MTKDTLPWLWIIGIGDDGLNGLTTTAKRLTEAADVVVGGKRHLSFLNQTSQELIAWPSPWSAMTKTLVNAKHADKKVVVLASGDPFWFGAGSLVAKQFERHDWISIPHPSSFQFAAHKLGWPLQSCKTITLHGRPTSDALNHFGLGGKVLALAESKTASELRTILDQQDFKHVEIHVLAHLAGDSEAVYKFESGPTEELVVLAFDLSEARLQAPLSGLPDDAFKHDGQLTKQEVRSVTLSRLAPADNEVLWDLGAGCGSIAIEWCRLNQTAKAIAFERDDTRIEMINKNAPMLAAFNLQVCRHNLNDPIKMPAPNAIFIIFQQVWVKMRRRP